MGQDYENRSKREPLAPVVGVHDERQLMSRPHKPATQPTFTPGPIDPTGASDAYGHYAEHPRITLQPQARSDQNMSPAPKKYDYSQDVSRTDRTESRRRETDMLRGPEQTMSDYTTPATDNKPPRAIDGQNVSMVPHERTLGEKVKVGVGKVWASVENVFHPDEEPMIGPPQLPVLNPNGTIGDHYPDGRPLEKGPIGGGGTRG